MNIAVGGRENAINTSPWKYFEKINEKDFSDIDEVIADFEINPTIEVYDMKGLKVSNNTDNIPNGLYIIRQGNLSKKVSVK